MSDTIRQVRVIKVPQGEVPEWVRRAWVGLILPDEGPAERGISFGLQTGRPCSHKASYTVPMKEALKILAQNDLSAAQWFIDFLRPSHITNGHFIFGGDECEPVSSPATTRQISSSQLPISDWQPELPD